MSDYRLYVYPTLAGQMAGQLFRDGEIYFGIGGCTEASEVIEAAGEQLGPDGDLEILYEHPPEPDPPSP